MAQVQARARKFTRIEYERMAARGILRPDERVELLDGEIFVMAAKGSRHTTAVQLLARALERVFRRGFTVRRQDPLAVDRHSEPEPDLAVVRGKAEDFRHEHPQTAVLVVEVSDTTLPLDQGKKLATYARAGIQDYWIVNLRKNVVEGYRSPVRLEDGFGFAETRLVPAAGWVSPLAAPRARIKVASLFE